MEETPQWLRTTTLVLAIIGRCLVVVGLAVLWLVSQGAGVAIILLAAVLIAPRFFVLRRDR